MFHKEVLTRLAGLPGVRAASLFNFGLLSGNYWTADVVAEGYQPMLGENLKCSGTMLGGRFFETFGIPLLSGRSFETKDEFLPDTATAAPKTAVINQALARHYFGDANPLGRRLYFAHDPENKIEIVGVVPDAKYESLRAVAPPTIYTPFFREDSGATFALRTTADPRALMASLQRVMREVDRNVRVRDLRTMDDVVNISMQQERLIAQLGGFFSVFALALSCLGLYGVLSFAVVQRTREIGVRMALGAKRRDVLFLIIGKGLKLILVGAMFGLVGGIATTRLISSLLYGVTPTDPVTFGGVMLLLVLVAVLASCLPAYRAAKVDPIVVLRSE
jgi:predicted permease